MTRRLLCGLLAGLAIASLLRAAPRHSGSTVDFSRDILPLLRRSCVECHGPDRQRGGLRLDSRAAAFRGGDRGQAILPGDPDRSPLIHRIRMPRGFRGTMPPAASLSAAEIGLLRDWIAEGAVWPERPAASRHWAYVPPRRPVPPRSSTGVTSPVDAFILDRLERERLVPAPEADRVTLLRRVSFDLIGLPPTPDEVEAFLRDRSPLAYERVVDRLLASPHFGERWARQWLDLARYADSHGFQRDDLRPIWPYRDWVIRALNADMPFDQFTVEQVAGDLLPGATLQQKIATGFHRCAPTNVEAGSDPEDTRVNQVFDRVNTTGTVWLGTTLDCAQCHDHKSDPFTQKDYYRLFAFFNNTFSEADRTNPRVPGSIRFLGPYMKLNGPGIVEAVGTSLHNMQGPGTAPMSLVMHELPRPRPTHVLLRGDLRSPGETVTAGIPAALHPLPGGPATRLALARWLVDRRNPLVARVTVNRWWAELFGRGLVATPEDFGVKGEPPTHPELLDWLAVGFMEHGWSMKRTLRAIVTSAAYRRSSRMPPEQRMRDEANRFLARGPRFRLDAETIRDNALAVSGLLTPRFFGPPIRPYQPAGLWLKVGGEKSEYVVSRGDERNRRGVYVVWKRSTPYPSFATFDAPARQMCSCKRARTNTPLQALTLLNDPVYVEAAQAFARRVLTERPTADFEVRARYAVRLCLGRDARPIEIELFRRLHDEQRKSSYDDAAGTHEGLTGVELPPGIEAAEFAAWCAVTTVLLNLDETITKE
ncbi:MAG: PSD1 and planctomycete cytochrome C domain-containing protein [Gemmataceae bacterium]